MKKHRLDNGDYPYENGHMNGEFLLLFFFFLKTQIIRKTLQSRANIA